MRSFEHAAASRTQAEAMVARVEVSDGRAGGSRGRRAELPTRPARREAVVSNDSMGNLEKALDRIAGVIG